LNIRVEVNLFLLIDDSETENSGRHMGSAGFFKCHSAERKHIFGHNFVLMLASFNSVAVPGGIRLYLKEEYCGDGAGRMQS